MDLDADPDHHYNFAPAKLTKILTKSAKMCDPAVKPTNK